MRTITQQVNLYKYKELSQDIKDKLVREERDWYCDMDLKDDMTLDVENQLELNPDDDRTKINVWYDFGYCQGDGFSFDCENLQLIKAVQGVINGAMENEEEKNILHDILHYEGFTIHSKHGQGMYAFASKSDVDGDTFFYDDPEDKKSLVAQKAIDAVAEWYVDFCNKEKKLGYAIIEDDDYFSEVVEERDDEYTESGEIYHA